MYEELYEQNKAELHAIAWHFRGLCRKDYAVSVEDLTQAAFIGLVKASQAFDKNAGKSWLLCKRQHITHEIYSALGLNKRNLDRPQPVSLDEPLPDTDGDITLGDLLQDDNLPDVDNALLREAIQQSVRNSISRLTDPRQRRVLMLHGIEGRNMDEVAEILGVDNYHALYIYNRAMANLAQDNEIMASADLDDRTRFYKHKSVKAFFSDRTSVTEEAVLWRIDQKEKIDHRLSTHS